MAESRREKKIPATFHFLHWQRCQCCQCCDHRSLGSGQCRPLVSGQCRPLVSGQCRLLGSGRCRPLARVDAGLWFGTMPALGSGQCRPLVRDNAGPWIRAFILTASKSRINDETPLNSCTLQGRSSLFREIAVLG